MITLHFHLQPQYKYELFHIYFTYWILKASKLAKSVKFRCAFCREMARRVETQRMADLPSVRLAPLTPPFHYTACDYFGPFKVKVGRNKTAKHYGVIFTCLNTRAVHLEKPVDCSTMEFMQVLRRFFSTDSWLSSRNEERKWISDDRGRQRTTRNGQGF